MTDVAATRSPLVRRAWLSLLGFLVSAPAALVLGQAIASALDGEPAADGTRPGWVMLSAGVPAIVVFALPAVAAFVLGRRAVDAGDDRGWVPALLGAVVAGFFVLVNVVSAVAILLG